MTGFGAASCVTAGAGPPMRLGVEVRSVNQRFLEVKIRQPFGTATEHALRRGVEARLGRGRVELLVHLQPAAVESKLHVGDVERIAEVLAQAAEVGRQARRAGLELAPFTAIDVLRLATARTGAPASEAPEAAPPELPGLLDRALDALCAMREAEGATLAEVLGGLVGTLEGQAAALAAEIAGEAARLHDRLRERLAALCERAGVSPPAPERVAQEVAVLVQRGDIEEELARLASHLAQVRAVLAAPMTPGQGKTLDFLSQELSRELTTIGSKITSHTGSAVVIAAKASIERIREQVQNVE